MVFPGGLFTMDVIAQGFHIIVKVNGTVTADYNDKNQLFKSGHIALRKHDGRTRIEFREIEIKELNGTPVPTARSVVPEAGTQPTSKSTVSSTDTLQTGTSWRGTGTVLVRSWTNDVAPAASSPDNHQVASGYSIQRASWIRPADRMMRKGRLRMALSAWKVAKENYTCAANSLVMNSWGHSEAPIRKEFSPGSSG